MDGFSELIALIKAKNWIGVLILSLLIAVGVLWFALNKANDRNNNLDEQHARELADLNKDCKDEILLMKDQHMATLERTINRFEAKESRSDSLYYESKRKDSVIHKKTYRNTEGNKTLEQEIKKRTK